MMQSFLVVISSVHFDLNIWILVLIFSHMVSMKKELAGRQKKAVGSGRDQRWGGDVSGVNGKWEIQVPMPVNTLVVPSNDGL